MYLFLYKCQYIILTPFDPLTRITITKVYKQSIYVRQSMEKGNEKDVIKASDDLKMLLQETQKVIVGQDRLMKNLIIALLAKGHIILEWVPGLAKTLAIETLGKTLGIDVARIQFTPDVLPSDIIGTQIWNQWVSRFETQKWPIFTHLLLADEINRAPAKVQSALLEAMSERQVTIWETSYDLDAPFVVMATQNPIEQDWTYDLPEAQLDRFLLKTKLWYPTEKEEIEIMKRFWWGEITQVKEVITHERILQIQQIVEKIHISDSIYEYVKNIITATRSEKGWWLTKYLKFWASPRASIAMITCSKVVALMHGRTFVIPEDIQEIVEDVLQHRLILTFEAYSENILIQDIIKEIIQNISVV